MSEIFICVTGSAQPESVRSKRLLGVIYSVFPLDASSGFDCALFDLSFRRGAGQPRALNADTTYLE